MKKTILQKTADRLSESPEGKVLLDLIGQAGNPAELARKIGVHAQLVRQWIYQGKISICAAEKVGKVFGKPKEFIRPDIAPSEWVKKPVEPKPPRVPVARTDDARFLVALAEKHGGVASLCKLVGCTPDDYRNWKSRGRIPLIKLPTLLTLK